jgi:Pentatricopeptide repeat domain
MMAVQTSVAVLLLLVSSTTAYAPICPSFVRTHQCQHQTVPRFALASQQDDVMEIISFDEDDYEETTKTFSDFMTEMIQIARQKKKDKSAGEKAQAVFDEMYEAYMMEDNASLWPNTTIYNILVDIHAWSPNKDGAQQAQHILDRMEDLTLETIARPNVATYSHVLEGWANRNAPEQAELVVKRMEDRFEKTANVQVQPTTGVYNKLIKAWMMHTSDDAPVKAEAILRDMIAQYQNGNRAVKPNSQSFSQVMRAVGKKGDDERVKALHQEMAALYRASGDADFQPDTRVYNELVASVAKGEDGATAAEAILYEMMELSRNGIENIMPNAVTFRNVINAFKGNYESGVAYKVEKLLELQEGLYGGSNSELKVDARTYNAAIQVMARTRNPEKAAMTLRLLEKMKASKDPDAQPNLATYNNVLSACAFSNQPDDAKEVFRIAINAFNELREGDTVVPDVTSYGYLLKCCNTLLPPNVKKDAVIENIFLKCCKDGQVGRFVLAELMEAASEELATKLLGGSPQDGVKIPRGWSKNVQNKKELLQ